MITKTEVERAILENEKNTGWGALDRSLTQIARGDLFLLIEAAKRAPFYNQYNGDTTAPSNSNMVLVDE